MSEITRALIARVGVDLAKRVIQVHAVDAAGRRVVSRALKRDQFRAWCVQLPPGCVVAMEACSSAHHWARKLRALGLDARLIAANFVSPYRMEGKSGKNDATDAAAICEAASRPNMRFVPIKTDSSNCTSRRSLGWQGDDQPSVSSSVRQVIRSSQASTRVRCGYVDAAAR